jgi:urease accessory protein UreH
MRTTLFFAVLMSYAAKEDVTMQTVSIRVRRNARIFFMDDVSLHLLFNPSTGIA